MYWTNYTWNVRSWKVCNIVNTWLTIGLCLSISFSEITLLLFKILDQNGCWARFICNLKMGVFWKIACCTYHWHPNGYGKLLGSTPILSFKFSFLFIVYVLGLQHELAQIMHVFWLSKHDAHYSVTENPIVPYLCAFVGTMFMKNKKLFVIRRE